MAAAASVVSSFRVPPSAAAFIESPAAERYPLGRQFLSPMLPPGLSDTRRVINAMREVGAISPATARPMGLLPDDVRLDLERHVQSGLIREGAPGTFYLFAPATPPWTPARVAKAVLFWLIVVIVPVIILQLSNMRSPP